MSQCHNDVFVYSIGKEVYVYYRKKSRVTFNDFDKINFMTEKTSGGILIMI